MMSNNRAEYGSPLEWLSALKQDGLWLAQLKQLQDPTADAGVLREAALRKIGQTLTFEFWDSYGHQVEPVVTEVWEIAELSLPKLKIQTIGMLSMEWLEANGRESQRQNTKNPPAALVDALKPMFFGSEEEAGAFLTAIQGMKPKQITDKVNQLVAQKKISELSKHRDLWKVLHNAGIYAPSESNWNQQVK